MRPEQFRKLDLLQTKSNTKIKANWKKKNNKKIKKIKNNKKNKPVFPKYYGGT